MAVVTAHKLKFWASLFTLREWIAAALFLLLAIAVSFYAGYRFTLLQETALVNDTAESVTRDIYSALNDSRHALNKFGAAHRGLEESGEEFNHVYAELFLKENPAVNSIGSFYHEYDWLLPINHVGTGSGSLSDFMGINLGGDHALRDAIARAVSRNSVATGVTPASWPDDADVVLIQPHYQFAALPPFDQSLEESFSGGFWMSISFKGFMDGFYTDPDTAKLNSRITLTHANPAPYSKENISAVEGNFAPRSRQEPKTFFTEEFLSNREVWFQNLFKPITSSREVFVGGARLVVSVEGRAGFSNTHVLVGFLVLGILLSIALVSMFIFFNRRISTVTKINSLRAVTRERAKAERALNSIAESVISLDNQFQISYINRVGLNVLGVDNEQLLGRSIKSALNIYEIENTGIEFDVQAALEKLNIGETAETDVLIYDPERVAKSMLLSMTNSTDRLSKQGRYTLVLRDVSEERTLTRELEYQANHDSLTGIWNRYYFENRLKQLVDRAQLGKATHALVYMDLDQFKIVNDTCGHAAGDRLLCELTTNLNAILRTGDVLARLGGDEFGLLIVNADREESLQVANRIYSFFQNSAFYHETKAFPVRASIGYVFIDERSSSVSDVLSAADMSCYSAKDSGRNNLNIYSEDNADIAQQQADMNWLPRLRKALKEDQFSLLLQAVADTKTQDIKHYEFLLRLHGDNGEVVLPHHFIQAAERYDLITAIDQWVVKEATRIVATYSEALGAQCSFSINLSGQSAADANFLPYIEQCIEESGIQASSLWFEITETAAITHFQVAVQLFQKLRSLGAKVALDDFGSGLSSFGYLKNLPVDVIKIDGQFVRNIDTDLIDQAMVRAIHQVSNTMGIESVAEFVETEAALHCLAEIGVDLAQGYVIAKPCSVDEAIVHQQQRLSGDTSGMSNAA